VTGVTGFVGGYLKRELLKEKELKVVGLVRPESAGRQLGLSEEGVEVVWGDVTLSNMGLEESCGRELKKKVTHIFHLAALYDTGADRERLVKENVIGTKNVLKFAHECKRLKKLVYVSTAYVAGKSLGKVKEGKLQKPALGFHNNYEESKFLAERAVREEMGELPVVIIRPSIVVGDSRSGYVNRVTGLISILRMAGWGRLVVVPGKMTALLNMIPVDVLAQVLVVVMESKKCIGKSYHATDPNPMVLGEGINMITKKRGLRKPVVLLAGVLAVVLGMPAMGNVLGRLRDVLEFLNKPVMFETRNFKRDILDCGLVFPSQKVYLTKLVDFVCSRVEERVI